MNDTVYDFIMQVRSAGQCNMLDVTAVARYAYDHEMYELVTFLDEQKKEYVDFIFHGKR